MICKVHQGSDFGGIANYIANELRDARVIDAEGVCTLTTDTMATSFQAQALSGSTTTKFVVGHFALSWHPSEKARLTDWFMSQLAREFMAELGYSDTQFVIARHNDTDHPHCHIMYNRVGNDGRALNDSMIRKRVHRACRKLEAKHGLYRAGKSTLENVNRDKLHGADYDKFPLKKLVLEISRRCHSWPEFQSKLEEAGVKMSFRYSHEGGIKGVIFSDGEHSYGGGKLHKELSLSSLDKRFGNALFDKKWGKELPPEAIERVEKSKGQVEKKIAESQPKPGSSIQSDDAEDMLILAAMPIQFLFAPAMALMETDMIISHSGGGSSNDMTWSDDDKEKNRPVKQPKFIHSPSKRKR